MRPNHAGTPLNLDDFALTGFDHLLAPLDQMLRGVEIRGGEPRAPTVADAIFVPAMKVGLHLFEGALLTSDGQLISQARSERRNSRMGDLTLGKLSQPVALHLEQTIEEEVIYLGWYFDHFGHFLLESLARTWILPQLDPHLRVVFHRERQVPPSGTSRRLLELVGITPDRILWLDSQTRLRRVIVPEPLYEISYAAHARMPQPYRQIAAAVGPGADRSDQPLYLSRRLLSSRQRPIIGEFELEEVCRENGFLVAHPETMTLADQIRLVNRHREIFTSAGSAAYLPLFARDPPRLHTLTTDIPFVDYFLIPKVAGISTSFVNCLAGGNRPSGHYLPQQVEMDVFAGYLDSLGLLPRRLRSSLTTQNADFRPAYDEAWFYKYLRHGMRTEPLTPELAAEASHLARTSWPLSWTLARYCMIHDPSRVDHLLWQFVGLVTTETNVERLAHYRDDIAMSVNQLIRHCAPTTTALLTEVLADRLVIDPAQELARGVERRRRQEEQALPAAAPVVTATI